MPDDAPDARCWYCGRAHREADDPREHVIADALGGTLTVPCAARVYNERAGREIDFPLQNDWFIATRMHLLGLNGRKPVVMASVRGGMTEKVGIDPAFVSDKVQVRANDYVAGADPANPAISPLFADLRGLPPMLIQAGSNEILLDDSTRLAARAAAQDVAVILDVTPGVPHVFQSFAAVLEEGDIALDRVTEFLSANTGAAARP